MQELQPVRDPAAETARGLPAWPDAALWKLARELAAELHRRQLPMPAALPVTEATAAAIDASGCLT